MTVKRILKFISIAIGIGVLMLILTGIPALLAHVFIVGAAALLGVSTKAVAGAVLLLILIGMGSAISWGIVKDGDSN